jgi:SAM-dependent methyltransferase
MFAQKNSIFISNFNFNKKMTCHICDSTSITSKLSIEGYQKGDFFDILYCDNCNTSFVKTDDVSPKIYDTIYNKGFEIPGYDRYHKYSAEVLKHSNPLNYLADEEDVYWGVREVLLSLNSNSKPQILEVGCGLGYLTYSLNKVGYQASGLDISSKAIDIATKTYGPFYKCENIFDVYDLYAGRYDVIILTEVIEHLESPIEFISALSKMLSPTGKLIITTPNKSSYPANVYWDTELPPVHLYWFSEKSMNIICEKVKMNCIFVDFTKYNLYHLDKTKLKYRGVSNRRPFLDENFDVIGKEKINYYRKNLLKLIKFFGLKKVTHFLVFSLLGDKRNIKRRQTICAVLTNQQ